MRYGLKLSQKAPIDEHRTVWKIADEAGFDHCWNMDHFVTLGGEPTGTIYEAWAMLAAMAEATTHVRIGCMVTGNTYRHPGVLAKTAVTVDHLSGGRLEFGLGAAWAENEHTMLGLEFGTVRDRLDRLAEACEIIKSLWTADETTFMGEHYRLDKAIAEPKPLQRPHPPIWIGGTGRKRTLRIVAEHADVWNAPGGSPSEMAELSAVLDEHCAAVGRNPTEIRRTVQLRLPENTEDLLPLVSQYAEVGIEDVILIVMGGTSEAQSRAAAAILPRLKEVS